MPSKNTSDSSCLCSNKTLLFVVVLRIVISQSTECSMCLFNVKLIVIFHVGTKWFAQGTPEFMTCDASQKTEHTMKTALLKKKKKEKRKKENKIFPICLAVQNIILCRGSCIPFYNLHGSCCSFFSENIYIL
uniref:Uncharacterized protein n=1 Tax=Pipistrellus kuhlii TaxID=59472 RepID=A0A7J8A7M7_PIPKU|nr:hypothetical protein mPipKuh1_008884 [Pipistrellus kuhlii]